MNSIISILQGTLQKWCLLFIFMRTTMDTVKASFQLQSTSFSKESLLWKMHFHQWWTRAWMQNLQEGHSKSNVSYLFPWELQWIQLEQVFSYKVLLFPTVHCIGSEFFHMPSESKASFIWMITTNIVTVFPPLSAKRIPTNDGKMVSHNNKPSIKEKGVKIFFWFGLVWFDFMYTV